MKIYGVTGWKNAGKTGLMERLVAEITSRGLSVSTISMPIIALTLIIRAKTATGTALLAPMRCCWRRKIVLL